MRSTLVAALFCAGLAAAQPNDAKPAFEAASVKPNVSGSNSSRTSGTKGQVVFTNVSLQMLVVDAFRVKPFQVVGPGWMESVRFDITAKYPGETKDKDRPLMLRGLLEDRFQLAVHRESKEFSGYALVVAKGGFKLKPVADTDNHNTNTNGNGKVTTLTATEMSMANLAASLATRLGTPVVDRTGIEGVFNIELKWNTDDAAAATDAAAPATLFTALQETLGLRLQSQKVPVEMVVIDKIERTPTEN